MFDDADSQAGVDPHAGGSEVRAVAIDPQVLEILVCPTTGQPLHIEGDHLVSEDGQHRYPIRDGIALLLPKLGNEAASDGESA